MTTFKTNGGQEGKANEDIQDYYDLQTEQKIMKTFRTTKT